MTIIERQALENRYWDRQTLIRFRFHELVARKMLEVHQSRPLVGWNLAQGLAASGIQARYPSAADTWRAACRAVDA